MQNDEHIHEKEGDMRSQVLTGSDNLEVNKGDQHGHQRSHCVENTICNIHLQVQLIDEYHSEHMNWDYVNEETVSTPRCDHVKVVNRTEQRP